MMKYLLLVELAAVALALSQANGAQAMLESAPLQEQKALITTVHTSPLSSESLMAGGNPEKTRELVAVLGSQAGVFEKARACQQLASCGTRDAVPALAALLPDPRLSAYARGGLEAIPDPSAAAALRAALAAIKGNQLAGVINSLGMLRDEKAVETLRLLAASPESGVSREALLALGRISTSESIAVLQQVLADGSEISRPAAAAACLIAAEQQTRNPGRAVALYDLVRRANVPLSFRLGATRGAILARQQDGVGLLIEQLKSADRAFRNVALEVIREMPGDKLANALNAELESAPQELRILLIKAMADCHNSQTLRLLRNQVSSDNPEIRVAALAVLRQMGGPSEAGVLLRALADNRSETESALAMSGLGRIPGYAVNDLLLKALQAAANAELRVKLIQLLSHREAIQAAGELIRQANDAQPKVSIAALRALEVLAGATEVPALIALVKTSQGETVRDAAESALANVCRTTDPAVAVAAAVLTELTQATDATEKNSWIRILTTLGYGPALSTLQSFLSDSDERVAACAIDQLGRWPDPTPIEALLARAETGANPTLRQRALAAAITLAAGAAEEHQRTEKEIAAWFQRAQKTASSVESKRLLISGLGNLKTVAALYLLRPYLEDSSVQHEAALAVLQISQALASRENRLEAKPMLERILVRSQDPDLRKKTTELMERIDGRSQESK